MQKLKDIEDESNSNFGQVHVILENASVQPGMKKEVKVMEATEEAKVKYRVPWSP